ncbi:MAG: FAD-binding oxidoreductase [Bacteroidales bacterium]
MTSLSLPIREVRVETPRTRVVRLALSGRPFDFRPGQSLVVGLHGQALRKPYSIACSPEQARALDAIELLVQVGSDASAGAHLGAPAAGDILSLDGPFGTFCFPDTPVERDFLFIAGGTGIAPLRSMLWHALAAITDARASLFYSARAADEFAYRDEFRQLAVAGRLVLRETVTREVATGWTGETGRITRAHVAATATPATLCFVCGPPTLVEDVTGWLTEIGIAREKILSEGWG